VLQHLLELIARALDQAGISYMVIGGQAVLLYGEPRLTRDIDITLGVGPERFAEIQRIAARLGWRVLVEAPGNFVEKTLVLPCLDSGSGIRIDFIFSFSIYEREALKRVRRVEIGDCEVCFASVEDVLVHKIIAGRARDLEDARTVMLKNPAFDAIYVRQWLQEFDRSLGEQFSRRFEQVAHNAGVDLPKAKP
jgi:predicted nucleotidyltransferase